MPTVVLAGTESGITVGEGVLAIWWFFEAELAS